ncbi:MAG TPA: hypothetical protein PKY96_16255 [Flavobacteriales bacterium]|nr:hypothetical protein [Flavobacteriales bacterium]
MKHLFALLLACIAMDCAAQSTGDYRSATSGDWSTAATWQRFNGTAFVAAPSAPVQSDGVISIRANHTVTRNSDITIDQVIVEANGTLEITSGLFSLNDGTGTDLQILGTCSLTTSALSGPGLAQVANGGVLTITNGGLTATSTVNGLAGGTVNTNGSGTVPALGTINNAGTWNMQGGNLGQPTASGGPCAFNNLPGGVVNLNNWLSTTNSWQQVTNNQGTFNKNNGNTTFNFSNDFSGKQFNNLSGGILNANAGNVVLSCTVSNNGSMVAGSGARIIHNTAAGGSPFTNLAGGAISGEFEHGGGTLIVNAALTFSSFILSGGVVTATEPITIPSGGQFTWTGGRLDGTTVLNINSGATATANGTTTLDALGIINNAGTWALTGGNLGQSTPLGGPTTFNNLPGGVVNLNNWLSTTNSWHQVTNNQGTITKNNGTVPFGFSSDFSSKAFNNLSGGVLHVATGECVFNVPVTNNGSITGGAGSQINFDGASTGSFFTNATGGTVSIPFHLLSSQLHVEAPLALNSFTMLNGSFVVGPAALTITAGGTANLNGGVLTGNAILNVQAGAAVNHNSSGTFAAQGTINNAGTWNMQNGSIGQPNFVSGPLAFNNLVSGVVNLNGWSSTTNTWHMVTNNAGTFNKNNGAELFTFSNDFSGKSFTNAAGGVFNVNSGTVAFQVPMPLQHGTFNVASGAVMDANVAVDFAGPAVVNNGTITGPVLRYQGTSAQQLNGTGTISNLSINNAAGVDLGGEQTVTNTLTMTNGQLRLGSSNLFVENNAPGAVAGGNATSWVVSNGTGSLHRQVIGSNYLFPIGTSSYTPLTLGTTGPQDRFSVRVQDGVSTNYGAPGVASGAPITARAVGRTWVVAEQVSGGNTGDITVQWSAADELPLFNRSLCAVSRYDGTDWLTGTYAAAIGGDPFTRTLSGVSSFREFSVSDNLLNLNTAVEDRDASTATPRIFPQPADHVLHVVAPEGRMIRSTRLYDASGRVMMESTRPAAERMTLDVGVLPAGLYVIEWADELQLIGRASVIIAH